MSRWGVTARVALLGGQERVATPEVGVEKRSQGALQRWSEVQRAYQQQPPKTIRGWKAIESHAVIGIRYRREEWALSRIGSVAMFRNFLIFRHA